MLQQQQAYSIDEHFARTGRYMWCDQYMEFVRFTGAVISAARTLVESFMKAAEQIRPIFDKIKEYRACYYEQYREHPAVPGSAQLTIDQRDTAQFRRMYDEQCRRQHRAAEQHRLVVASMRIQKPLHSYGG